MGYFNILAIFICILEVKSTQINQKCQGKSERLIKSMN